ncbi:SLAP domain-containing protein [Schleiferilactobacillus perolens]|uniref:Surface layer protein A domain-containing protein n=1 Tax=Schleiferilactobacillus perolens DSM 12744 TaxID=1423792 RepID=A0A0R1N8E9_9LACO|nr:SLAP domain-containing protein [Schleiferilactobacillus perolens]KRL12600.1 hypothetical protein FD09_GL002920 [Schleiferilactobacillus perolens DSM 12744]
MKKISVALLGAALFGVGLTTALTTTQIHAATPNAAVNQTYQVSEEHGVVQVGRKTVQLYADANLTTPVDRYLAFGTRWRYSQINHIYVGNNRVGDLSYEVGTNLWLPGQGTMDKIPDYIVNAQFIKGIATVTNPGGATLYTDAHLSHQLSRKLPFKSAWRFKIIMTNEDGDPMAYEVGTGLYVRTADVRADINGVFTVQNPVNVAGDISVYRQDLTLAERTLSAGTRWVTTNRQILADGRTYYQVGTNLWVWAGDGTWASK